MTTSKDVAEQVGKMVMGQAAKNVAAELKGGGMDAARQDLNNLLNEVVSRQSRVVIAVSRYDLTNPTVLKYVGDITDVDPNMLLQQGLESTVKAWCGGGRYVVRIRAEGIPEKSQSFTIEGEPLPPLPERKPPPPGAILGMNGGQFMAGPGFASYLGFPNSPSPGDTAATKAMSTMEGITSILLAKALGGQESASAGRESDEMRALREMVADLKREKELAIASAQHQREMAELNAKLEKLAAAHDRPAPTEGTFEKMLALATAVLPAALQAKSASDAVQMQLLTTVLQQSKPDNTAQMALVNALLSKPDQSDQMLKVYEAMGSMMGTSVQLTQGIINQMASLQGENRPWWQEAALQLAGSIGDIAQAAMSKSEKVSTTKVEGRSLPAPEDDADIDDAAAAAAAAAQQQLGATPPPPQLEGFVGPSRKDQRFSSDFFVKVFSLIEGTAPAHEIAFRAWKHATSGDAEALAWVRDPQGYTEQMLLGFVQRSEMALTEERFEEILAAMNDLHEHFRNGGTAEAYVAHYGIKVALPKRVHTVPIERATDEERAEQQRAQEMAQQPPAAAAPDQKKEEDDEDDEVAPEEAAPAAPAVATEPTPGLDRVPPPPSRDVRAVVHPERLPPPASPMAPAAASIPTEPKV